MVQQQNKNFFLDGMLPGAVGGSLSVLVGHPFDTIKVMIQSGKGVKADSPTHSNIKSSTNNAFARNIVSSSSNSPRLVSTTIHQPQKMSVMGILRATVSQHGFSGLYRGVTAPLLAVTPTWALVFLSYEYGKETSKRIFPSPSYNHSSSSFYPDDELTITQYFFAGAITGIPAALVLCPSERVKCLLQTQSAQYKGMGSFECARLLCKQQGLTKGLFRGFGITFLRDSPGNAFYFGTYEYVKREIIKWESTGNGTDSYNSNSKKLSTKSIIMAGGLAGVVNWIVALPFDTVKSKVQTSNGSKNSKMIDVAIKLVKREGFQALYRGLSPALLRAFPANAAAFLGVEMTRSFLCSFR